MRVPPTSAILATAAFILSIACQITFAQEQLRLQRLNTNEGLSQADVRAMVQDKDGFLWIGTRDGLNRYDGLSFKTFFRNEKDSTTIRFNQITHLQTDESGNIWIASIGGISCYERKSSRFLNYPFRDASLINLEVNKLWINGDDLILLSTQKGIISFDLNSKRFFRNDKHKAFENEVINHLYVDTVGGPLWVATTKNLYRLDNDPSSPKPTFPTNTHVEHILAEGSRFLISSLSGLFEYHTMTDSIRQIPLPDQGEMRGALQALRAKNGDLWIARHNVLVVDSTYKPKHLFKHEQGNPFSLSENRVRSIYQTRDGVIFMATWGYGLNKFNPNTTRFHYLGESSQPPLSSNYISTIFTTDDSLIYVGTTRGLDLVDLRNKTTESLLPAPDAMTLIFRVKFYNGKLWVSTSKGFFQIDKRKLLLKARINDVIDFVALDSSTLLFARYPGEITQFDSKSNEVKNWLPDGKIRSTLQTIFVHGKTVWVGANDGARTFTFAGKQIRHFRSTFSNGNGLQADVIKSFHVDHRNNIWIGTWGGGLSRFNSADSSFRTYSLNDGLPSNVVYGILEDALGTLWLSTNSGIANLDPPTRETKTFAYSDGLQGSEFNTGAYFRSLNGRMYFGGTNGLTIFNPTDLGKSFDVPKVLISEFSDGINRFHSPLMENGSVDVESSQVTIGYTSIDFAEPEKYEFQYKINDDDWMSVMNRRFILFADLPPGENKIRIRAKKSGSAWSLPTTLFLNVPTPFWQRPIVIISFLLVLFAGGFGLYRYRIGQLDRRNQLLAKIVAERTREVQTKNEEIQTQNEELQTQTEELMHKNLLLEQHGMELASLSSELESKVMDKTRDVHLLNEDLKKQNILLEQFAFIAAHNFGGPVARIKGLIQILQDPTTRNEELGLLFKHLRTSIDDLDQVTQDLNKILDIQRTTSDFFELVALKPLIQSTISAFNVEIHNKSAQVDLSGFENLHIKGTNAFVQSIFHNLVDNALKYSNSTVIPRLKITCRSEGSNVKIVFEDNGIGMDMKLVLNKMFRLYQRFSYGTTGRGIGLYLIKTQAELMHGTVSVESTPGVGSKFTLTFPKPDTKPTFVY